jgi:hypothetical protein
MPAFISMPQTMNAPGGFAAFYYVGMGLVIAGWCWILLQSGTTATTVQITDNHTVTVKRFAGSLTLPGASIERVTRVNRSPRTQLTPYELLTVHWPAGKQRVAIETTQLDAFLADIRMISPDVAVLGFETVNTATPHPISPETCEQGITEVPWQLAIENKYRRFLVFDTGSQFISMILGIVVSIAAIAVTNPPPNTRTGIIVIGTLFAAGGCWTYQAFCAALAIPHGIAVYPDHILAIRTRWHQERIPISSILCIHARKVGMRIWADLLYQQSGKPTRLSFPTAILPEFTEFISTLRTMNPAIVVEGFEMTR